jgi:hypothetical protein
MSQEQYHQTVEQGYQYSEDQEILKDHLSVLEREIEYYHWQKSVVEKSITETQLKINKIKELLCH